MLSADTEFHIFTFSKVHFRNVFRFPITIEVDSLLNFLRRREYYGILLLVYNSQDLQAVFCGQSAQFIQSKRHPRTSIHLGLVLSSSLITIVSLHKKQRSPRSSRLTAPTQSCSAGFRHGFGGTNTQCLMGRVLDACYMANSLSCKC